MIMNVLDCKENDKENKQQKEGIHMELVIMRDIEYSDNASSNGNAPQIMKSQLMITSIFHFEIGYPFHRLKPTVSVVLNRQIYQQNVQKFRSISDRSEQMLIERQLSRIVRGKLERLQTGANQLLRCVDLIQNEMELIMSNEASCRHSHRLYTQ